MLKNHVTTMFCEVSLLSLLYSLVAAHRSFVLVKYLDTTVDVQTTSSTFPAIAFEDCVLWMLQDETQNFTATLYEEGTCFMMKDICELKTKIGSTVLISLVPNVRHECICGLWPLTDEYGGKDVSGHGNDITFTNVVMPSGGIELNKGEIAADNSMRLENKFSWIARVNSTNLEDAVLFHYTCNNPTRMNLQGNKFFAYARRWYANCDGGDQGKTHSQDLSPSTWHTVAVSFDGPAGVMKMWVDGMREKWTFSPCSSRLTSDGTVWFDAHAKLRCMGHFREAFDYDIMLKFTAAVCGL